MFCQECDELGMYRCSKHGIKAQPVQNRKTRSSLRKTSYKQDVRTAFLMGVKAERILMMFTLKGDAWCQDCGKPADVEYAENKRQYVEQAMSELDLHHVGSRDKGKGYSSPSRHGVDSPTNLQLLCRTCHIATEPTPEWSTG